MLWPAGFGAFAIWAGLTAIPRFRSRAASPSVATYGGVVAGTSAILVSLYVLAAIASVGTASPLPAPQSWVGSSGTGVAAAPPEADAPSAADPEDERSAHSPQVLTSPSRRPLRSRPPNSHKRRAQQPSSCSTTTRVGPSGRHRSPSRPTRPPSSHLTGHSSLPCLRARSWSTARRPTTVSSRSP